MKQTLSIADLLNNLGSRLNFHLETGKVEACHNAEVDSEAIHRPAWVGFLNLIHSNKIQLLGREEIQYLDSLESRKRWATVAEIFSKEPLALIITDDQSSPDDLIQSSKESNIPILTTSNPGYQVLNYIQHYINRHFIQKVTLHGVFIEVFSIGILITGDSGSGKSELALELISRGHRMIADDAPEFLQISPDTLEGRCPPLLQDCLEVRGLGVLNIRQMFGDSAIKISKYLKLIINLQPFKQQREMHSEYRLRGNNATQRILDMDVPIITIPVAPGRNLAVIVEAAVRNHSLKMKGYDAADAFLARYDNHLKNNNDNTN